MLLPEVKLHSPSMLCVRDIAAAGARLFVSSAASDVATAREEGSGPDLIDEMVRRG